MDVSQRRVSATAVYNGSLVTDLYKVDVDTCRVAELEIHREFVNYQLCCFNVTAVICNSTFSVNVNHIDMHFDGMFNVTVAIRVLTL